MDERSLLLNEPRTLFLLDEFFATPALYSADMNEEEWNHQIHLMVQRELARRDFVDGILTPGDFMEALFQYGVDPLHAAEAWEAGQKFH